MITDNAIHVVKIIAVGVNDNNVSFDLECIPRKDGKMPPKAKWQTTLPISDATRELLLRVYAWGDIWPIDTIEALIGKIAYYIPDIKELRPMDMCANDEDLFKELYKRIRG